MRTYFLMCYRGSPDLSIMPVTSIHKNLPVLPQYEIKDIFFSYLMGRELLMKVVS